MATIVDVSRMAGVSTATVSRVLNKPDVVDAKTREIVNNAIEHLQYRPNVVARGLVRKSSKTVGVVVNVFGSPYYGHMIDGVETGLASVGFKAIAESSRQSRQGEIDAFFSLVDRQCEAIVLHSDNLSDGDIIDLVEKYPATVVLNRLIPDISDHCVYLDNRQGSAKAARYLLGMGHRKIAMIEGPDGFHQVPQRSAGFVDALAAQGLAVHDGLIAKGDFTDKSGAAAIADLLARPETFTAAFFHNDEMAAGAIHYCREAGIKVGRDISIMGFDNVDVIRHLWPGLTTIAQPLRAIGISAGMRAHQLATGKTSETSIQQVFEAEVVERASVQRIK